jgi:hypothetical protein
MTERGKSRSHSDESSITSGGLPNLTVRPQNKFKERDNMLRESSIAEDYWKQVIDRIKQQEAQIAEHNGDNNSSVVDSINGNFGNKMLIRNRCILLLSISRSKRYNDPGNR